MKFTLDASEFSRDVAEKLKEYAPQITEVMATGQVANNQKRLDQGIGLDDRPMPLYSTAYAAERAARGERTDVRNLVQTGRMRGAMAVQETRRTQGGAVSVIGFTDARARQLAFFNQQRTPFFGVSDADADIVAAIGQQELAKLTEG